jgi:hypothetical protein
MDAQHHAILGDSGTGATRGSATAGSNPGTCGMFSHGGKSLSTVIRSSHDDGASSTFRSYGGRCGPAAGDPRETILQTESGEFT